LRTRRCVSLLWESSLRFRTKEPASRQRRHYDSGNIPFLHSFPLSRQSQNVYPPHKHLQLGKRLRLGLFSASSISTLPKSRDLALLYQPIASGVWTVAIVLASGSISGLSEAFSDPSTCIRWSSSISIGGLLHSVNGAHT